MNGAGMKYARPFIIAALFCRTAAAGPEPVTCDSPCDCQEAHGEGRWSVKTDALISVDQVVWSFTHVVS